uniref:Uncharacterized protein n=1 Tax=Panagrolaimus sp. ES5 TaxID=591445 RepID=A0AC34G1F8_9BILA
MGGGLIFRYLEEDYVKQMTENEQKVKVDCVHEIFNKATNLTYYNYRPTNVTIENIIHCFHVEVDPRNQWSSLTAAFYGFGIATTLGYNRLQPLTLQGMIF